MPFSLVVDYEFEDSVSVWGAEGDRIFAGGTSNGEEGSSDVRI